MRRALTMLAIQLLGTAAFFGMVGTIFIMLVAAGNASAVDVALNTLEVSYD